jgi:hypothetical protein
MKAVHLWKTNEGFVFHNLTVLKHVYEWQTVKTHQSMVKQVMLPRPSADGRGSILQHTFTFIRGCERNVMVNCPAMLTMLNFETS